MAAVKWYKVAGVNQISIAQFGERWMVARQYLSGAGRPGVIYEGTDGEAASAAYEAACRREQERVWS